MSPSSPSTASVLTQVDSLGPPGTPVTIREIASAFDCAVERLDTRLDRLVSHRILKVKQVGDGRRVWWRPAGPQAVDPPDTAASPTPVRRGKQLVGGGRSSSEGSETDRLHSLVFDQTVQFTGVLDPDGTLLDANESALRFGGLSRDDVVGRPFWEADWWQLSRRAQRRLQAAISRAGAGEMVRYEVTVQGASRTVPIDFSLRPVSDDGEVTLLIAEGRDITDLKAHEQQLQRQLDALESELAEVLDRISDGFYSLDTGFRFRYINDHAQALLGVDESARGEDIRDTIETTEQFRTALETAVESQEPVFFEDYYEPLGEWFDNAIYPSETGLSIYFRDISERKRLETELRTETEHFQVALENSPIIAFRLDADLRYTWVGNPRREFPEEEILGKRDDELLEPEAAAVVMAPKRAALETGARVREEIVVGLPGGETIYDLTIEPLFDDAGEISGLTATAVDLTERTRTREALRRSEERLRLALQAADVGTWELDLRSEESPVRSLEHDRIFGYEEGIDDWSFEVFLDHVHPDDRAAVQRGFEEAFETGSWAFECRIRRADGRERWIAAEGEFHTDSDGEPVRAVGVVRDISDRMTRQRALEASERRYRTLVANFPNGGVALLDSALRHRIVDGLGFDAIGLDVEALRGRRVDEVFPAAIAAVLEPEYRATLDGEARSFELAVGERICEFRTIPLSNAKGVDGLLSIFQDITLRKTRQERQLTTLAGLNETVQEITHHVIESRTQDEIEQEVCDRFDAADVYTGAWVGRLDPTGATIRPSAAA
ncbi:MAG: PAS domain-containing protein, partial [Halohasta sp.]